MKFKNVIVIPPCNTYGDCLSTIGMLYFLFKYYDNVYLDVSSNNDELNNYFKATFSNDNKITLTNNVNNLLNSVSSEFHIINLNTGDWNSAKFHYFDNPNVNKDYYFNDSNPIYNRIDIEEIYKCFPNKHLPPEGMNINHLFYYELVGLNNNVRMDFFHHQRNLSIEENLKREILSANGISDGEKYNIINDPVGSQDILLSNIKNGYKTVNINFLSDTPGKLISLLEGAESIHFIEGSNVNFFYHCQYKNIFNYDGKIYLHVWLRNRNWSNYKLDYAYKMMTTPMLKNWNFIFSEDELKKII